MNRDLVLAEWRRAQAALRAAEVLTREACCVGATTGIAARQRGAYH